MGQNKKSRVPRSSEKVDWSKGWGIKIGMGKIL